MISPEIKLKDRITRRSEGLDDKKYYTGEVVYIHPPAPLLHPPFPVPLRLLLRKLPVVTG